ncbi:hypothetical protein [uncultured Erythrobacter sp.]|uniref:hypothetical protein n=1 Tax=uncultured Erythrobacter sp. TaxID=263913 RepID=UPI002636F534|nr:hypothetical protein [uncultured Erythrobacter sp.]
MKGGLAGLSMVLALLACTNASDTGEPLSVAEISSAQEDLIGKRIKVVGYVGKCHDSNCTVADNYLMLDGPPETYMAIGASETFDDAVSSQTGNVFGRYRIVFEATFSGRCLEFMDDEPMPQACDFRPDTLADPVFIEVREAPSSQQ